MENKSLLILATSFLVSMQIVFAEKKQEADIFKCTNAKGDVFYNDKPCPKYDIEKNIRAVKDPKGSVANGNNYSAQLSTLEVEEAKEIAKIEKLIDKETDKEIKKSGLSGTDWRKKNSKNSDKPITKADIASMTGAEKENYHERMELEQKHIQLEAEAGREKIADEK